MNAWLKPKQARAYAGGIDKRTWRAWKSAGLKTVTVGGIVLTKPVWVDQFILSHMEGAEAQQEVKQILRRLK